MAVNCSQQAEFYYEAIVAAAQVEGNNTFDKAFDYVNKMYEAKGGNPYPRDVAIDLMNEYMDSRKRKATNQVLKNLRAIKQEPKLDRAKRKQIEALELAIVRGDIIDSPKKLKRKVSAVLQGLNKRLEVLAPINKANMAIKNLERQLETGQFDTPKKKKQKVALQKKLDERKKDLQRQKKVTQEINELKRRLDEGDFIPTEREAQIMSDELLELIGERESLKMQVRQAEIDARPKNPVNHVLSFVWNDIRALLTAFDFSAVGIQGMLAGVRRPYLVPGAMKNMFMAMKNDANANKQLAKLKARDMYELGEQGGLHLAELDGGLDKGEEFFTGKLIKMIPGIKASERMFISYINTMRAAHFDMLATTLSRNGTPTVEEAEVIANYVNVMTGRGSSKWVDKHAEGLSKIFFSARYQLSRLQLLTLHPTWRRLMEATPETADMSTKDRIKHNYARSKAARALVARELLFTSMAMLSMYGLWALAGGELEDDPRSTDFGKIKTSDGVSIDVSGGLKSQFVMMSRILTREVKRGDGKVRDINFLDLANFGRGKSSPAAGLVIDWSVGKDYMGDEVTVPSTIRDNVVPISFQDFLEQADAEKIPRTAALTALGLFGFNTRVVDDAHRKN